MIKQDKPKIYLILLLQKFFLNFIIQDKIGKDLLAHVMQDFTANYGHMTYGKFVVLPILPTPQRRMFNEQQIKDYCSLRVNIASEVLSKTELDCMLIDPSQRLDLDNEDDHVEYLSLIHISEPTRPY